MSASLAGRDLVQAALFVTDLERSIAWYRDVLGLPLLFVTNGMAFFQMGAARLMLGEHERAEGAGGVLYFDAPDLPELAAALTAKGVTFRRPADRLQTTEAGDLMLQSFTDPDGNALALIGVVPRG